MAMRNPHQRAQRNFAISLVLLVMAIMLYPWPVHGPYADWFSFGMGTAPMGAYTDAKGNVVLVFGGVSVEPRMYGGIRCAAEMTFTFEDGKPLTASEIPAWSPPFASRRELVVSAIESLRVNVLNNARLNGVECGEELLRECLANAQPHAVVYDYGALALGLFRAGCRWLPLVTLAFVLWAYHRLSVIRKRSLAGDCQWCGYALGTAAICPECGKQP